MGAHIRPERVDDYAAIADVHVRAFGNRPAEAMIVALHRHRPAFDPDLSLVAEESGQIVAHVLFSARSIRLLDQDVWAVNLAPIAVVPEHQGKGIGAMLAREGHDRARAKGYALSFLLGHRTYYPRLGYRQGAFGAARARAATPNAAPETLEERAPQPRDVPGLQALWLADQGHVDFAIAPGPALLDWLSPNPTIEATVYLRGEVIVGYTRIHVEEPWQPRAIFTADAEAARTIVGSLAFQVGADRLTLPVHPSSITANACRGITLTPWEAAMACPLLPSPLADYLRAVEAGARPPGSPIWPVAFDLE